MDGIQIVQLPIPVVAMPMIEAAARAYGWTAKVATPEGEVDNPQSALERILEVSIRQVQENAISMISQQKADEAREATRAELNTVVTDWLALLRG